MAEDKGKWDSEIVPGVGFTEPTYVFVHCKEVETKTMFGKKAFTGLDCALEIIGRPIKCKLAGGLEKECIESIHLYDESPPTHTK